MAGGGDGVWGDLQFWETYSNAGLDGAGDGGWGLERLVSVVQPGAVCRAENSEDIYQGNASTYKRGRAVCDRCGWGANPAEQFEDGGDELAESAENASVQSGNSSRPAIFTWILVDAHAGRVQSGDPVAFSACLSAQGQACAGCPQREWEAGLSFLHWARQELDQAGRESQLLLNLADGSFDVIGFWRDLPERTVLAVRTARNRRLYYLPEKRSGPGRPASYGALAPHPCDWLHQGISWQKREIPVRGKSILMKFQVLGPFVREGLPEIPMFLFVVKGMHRKVGKKKPHYKHRKPSFYLVSAVLINGEWQLPLPVETILAWLWQRWELEVAHREMKSGFGVGEKQCWNPRSTISSVQWSVWVYALLLLSAYRTWGLLNAPSIPTRWWKGAKRWSFNTLWRQLRSALWRTPQFQALWTRTPNNWLKKEAFLIALSNSIAASTRI